MGANPRDGRSDLALLEAIADGDRGALGSLYERHAPWLFVRLQRRCADEAVVEEAVQDTFLAVWRRPQGYSGQGEVAAWIWGIGVRRLIGRLRRELRPLWRWPGRDSVTVSAEEQVLLGVEHGDLAAALDGLSPELRSVVQVTVLDGLTAREAARLLGIPSGTVKSRMARARVELREALT